MPPPRRAKIEISEAPNASAVSASTTDAVVGRVAAGAGQIPEEHRDREQAEAGDEHAGDRARAERHGQAALQAVARGFRGADVGADRDVHADEAGSARQDRADQEARPPRAASRKIADDDRDDDADDRDGRVLAAQIGPAPSWIAAGDFDHPLVAGGLAQHLAAGE